jgi:Bifunctional DNA primase/polymerase, N-terminal
MSTVVRIAENLVHNCGYAVFPCRLPDKTPTTPHGFLDATSDETAVANLWRRYPGPLIGIATGERSGVDVLDVDAGRCPADANPKVIAKREAACAWWHANAHRIPSSRAYETGSGGIHIYFKHAPISRTTQSVIAHGVDTRADGGYAIYWFGAGRECFDHNPPAEWPAWLLQALAPKPVAPPPRGTVRPHTNPAHIEDIIRRAIGRVGSAPEGTKHEAVRKSARLLGGIQTFAGFSDDEAVGWLRDALPAATVRDWRNVERTALWGLERGRQEPLDTDRRGAR